jgi:hypothetical protein
LCCVLTCVCVVFFLLSFLLCGSSYLCLLSLSLSRSLTHSFSLTHTYTLSLSTSPLGALPNHGVNIVPPERQLTDPPASYAEVNAIRSGELRVSFTRTHTLSHTLSLVSFFLASLTSLSLSLLSINRALLFSLFPSLSSLSSLLCSFRALFAFRSHLLVFLLP